jgi:phosphoribosylformylglycinamidine synthase subunit PurQ / glutaminase
VKAAVVVFPGSNCDHDCETAPQRSAGWTTVAAWHKDPELPAGVEAVILPGGFSYGDYLRCGAIAAISPIMAAVKRFAEKGGTVAGVCNGFQILCESGLLPGTLLRNRDLAFLCEDVFIKVESTGSSATRGLKTGDVLQIPIAHGDGNYFADEATLDRLEKGGQIIFRYSDRSGRVSSESNPNGSQRSIAGICNEKGNVIGMMPHPDRASERVLGSNDGVRIWEAVARSAARA